MKLFKFVAEILPTSGKVYAHCDIPCGIYDPKPAQIAAETVLKMVQKMRELPIPKEEDIDELVTYHNSVSRMAVVKEEHARRCEEEVLILWTDYFKPEHHKMFPDLTEKILAISKLCSKARQEVNEEVAKQLITAVDEVADIFVKTKAATK